MNWKRIRRLGFLTSCGGVLVFVAAAWLAGSALIAPAPCVVGEPPADLPFETIPIQSASGATLAGWQLVADGSRATVVLLHPLHGSRRSMLERARLLHDAGYSCVLIDFRGHGESTGSHITAGYLERHDVIAAVEHARSLQPDRPIFVLGRSLGGAAALLAQVNVDALVLESVYCSIDSAVRNRIRMRAGVLHRVLTPALLWQMQPRLGFGPEALCPLDRIAGVECPVLILGGGLDEETPAKESHRLYEAASADHGKELVIFEAARHEDLLAHDRERYSAHVLGFLSGCLARCGVEDRDR